MNMTQVVVQHTTQTKHPDRVSWYQTLIQEWTGQVTRVFVQADGMVAAWVMSYSSQVGKIHPGPTQVWSDTCVVLSIMPAFTVFLAYVDMDLERAKHAVSSAVSMLANQKAPTAVAPAASALRPV